MKNGELENLKTGLESMLSYKGKSFNYKLLKNIDLIEEELKIFTQLRKQPHPDYINFENGRTILCMKHAKKDENGQAIIENGRYDIEDRVGFEIDFADVKSKYQDVIDDMMQTENDMMAFMNKDTDIDWVKIDYNEVPNDISGEDMKKIKFLISE